VNTYQLIFQQGYDFITASKQLESIVQRIQEFIFILYSKDKVYAVLIMDDRYKNLFNNIQITLQEFELMQDIFTLPIYARLKYKQHYAIPFCLQPEPSPLYKVLADYAYSNSSSGSSNSNSISSSNSGSSSSSNTIPLAFFMHAYQRDEKVSIASYLRKHDIKRTPTFYAYADQIRQKLQATHYHTTLLLASNSKDALMKGVSAFKTSYFTHIRRINNYIHELEKQRLYKHIMKRPKKPLFSNQRYTVLSQTEVVSLMLPDSLMLRLTIDGIRPYTTGVML